MKNLIYNMARDRVKEEEKKKKEDPRDKQSVTHHAITLDGVELKYTATCGYMKMKDATGKVKADIFFTSYEKEGVKKNSERPITFCFNGGPGCSSPWLHFGVIGPKRVKLTDKGSFVPPPGSFDDNPHTWLAFTDLVFIDPVDTGYSRSSKEEHLKDFFGVSEDVESVGEFIRLFITRHKRWGSPKFLAGESYGTTRAAGLAGFLQDNLGIDLNGIVLISTVLNFQTLAFASGNDLPYVLYLPAYTATALYHNKLSPDMQADWKKTLKEVEEWTIGEYLVALARGDSLSQEERQKVISTLSRFTGLSEEFIDYNNLRISQPRFCKELLRKENRILGRLDSRYLGIDTDRGGDSALNFDPSFFKGPFFAAVNDFVRTTLKYENDLPYTPLSIRANMSWNWKTDGGERGFVNVADTLKQEIDRNPYLKVLVACGYYDLATPYFASVYTVNHLGLEKGTQENVKTAFYQAGHMMYYNKSSLEEFYGNVQQFFKDALNQKPIEMV